MTAVPAGSGFVTAAEAADGRLLLVRFGPAESGGIPWRALSTFGDRDVDFAAGVVPEPDTADPVPWIVRWSRPPLDMLPDARTVEAFLDDIARWEAAPGLPEAGPWKRFSAVCGRATPHAAYGYGRPWWLLDLDREHGAGRVDAAILGNPAIVEALRLSVTRGDREILLSPDSSRRALAQAVCRVLGQDPSRVPVAARLLSLWAGRAPPFRLPRILHAAEDVPLDWIPGDAEGMRSMVELHGVASLLSRSSKGTLGVGRLLSPVRGRWTPYLASMRRLTGQETLCPHGTCSDVADGVAAFREDVVDPLRALAREMDGTEPAGCATSMSWLALHGKRGLGAILQGARDWHDRATGIYGEVTSIQGARHERWPLAFHPLAAGDGTVVEAIADWEGLVWEGKRQGHCVSIYAPRCAKGECAIASIGLPGDAPSMRSTAELRTVAGRTVVAQHRGVWNGNPPVRNARVLAEAVAAIDARGGLVLGGRPSGGVWRALSRQRVPGRFRHLAYDPRQPDAVDRAIRAWSRLLRRDLRDPCAILALGDPEAAVRLRAGRESAASARGPSAILPGILTQGPFNLGDWLASDGSRLFAIPMLGGLALTLFLLMVFALAWLETTLGLARPNGLAWQAWIGRERIDALPWIALWAFLTFVASVFATYFVALAEDRRGGRAAERAAARRQAARAEAGPVVRR